MSEKRLRMSGFEECLDVYHEFECECFLENLQYFGNHESYQKSEQKHVNMELNIVMFKQGFYVLIVMYKLTKHSHQVSIFSFFSSLG